VYGGQLAGGVAISIFIFKGSTKYREYINVKIIKSPGIHFFLRRETSIINNNRNIEITKSCTSM